MVSKISTFIQEAKQEFDRVNWPTFAETARLTMLVIVMSLGVAAFLGVFDYLFTTALSTWISR